MNNKKLKISLIIVTVLAALLLVLTIAILVTGGSLKDAFNPASLFSRTTQAPTTTTEAPTTTTEAPTTTTVTPTTPEETTTEAPATTEAPQPMMAVLRVAVKGLNQKFNPFFADTEGDDTLVRLTQLNLLTYDRNGQIILNALDGADTEYNGKSYHYDGVSNISWKYDPETDITTYTLEIKKDLLFSDGEKLTIDDVIFNYYIRLQPDYTGNGNLRAYEIVGLNNYYYNNDKAESTSVSSAEIDAELKNPGEKIAAFIKNLIRDTLEAEKEECEQIWMNYQDYGYGNSAQEFFYKLYGFDLNYNPIGKTMDEVCEALIASYGTDYRTLAAHYAVDSSYFDEQVRSYAREVLLYNKIKATDGAPVSNISGVVRQNYYTMKLRVYGEHGREAVSDLFDVDLVPMRYYGAVESYDYYEHNYGFVLGSLKFSEDALKTPVGAGMFRFVSYEDNKLVLERNPYYYGGEAQVDRVVLLDVEYPLDAISDGTVDLIAVPGSRDAYDTIMALNTNKELSGEKVHTVTNDALGYSYVGLNAANVFVGNSIDSYESKLLRQAFCTVFAYYRQSVYHTYFGASAEVIEYPVSRFFGIAPTEGEADYSVAFSTDVKGHPIYTENMTEEERYTAMINAVKGFFKAAGYKFDEASGSFVDAPKNGKLLYEVLLCGDEASFHPSYYLLDNAKAALFSLGISLDIRYMNTEEDMLVALYMNKADMWCASWNTPWSPDLSVHYMYSGRTEQDEPNVYGIQDERLDRILKQLETEEDSTAYKQLARQAMDMVREWGIEVPCYQLTNYLIFNSQTVDIGSLADNYTCYWNWLEDALSIRVTPTRLDD